MTSSNAAAKPRGALEKISTGMLVLLFWVSNLTICYFGGLLKMRVIFAGLISMFFWSTGNLHYFFGLLRKETPELLPSSRFPLTLLFIFLD